MTSVSVPAAIRHHEQIKAGEISFIWYSEKNNPDKQLDKSLVIFEQVVVSFVLNGVKEIYLSAERAVITPGFGIVIPAGNSIMAEHSNNDKPYNSLLAVFPVQFIIDFLNLNQKKPANNHSTKAKHDFIPFKLTAYLNEYVKTIQELIRQQQQLSYAIAKHKLEELLLVLYELYPDELTALFIADADQQQQSLKKIVENNLMNNLSLTELAFLANRSLSSFKRDFEKAYGLAPQKYIREKKLEAARHEISKGERATELYIPYGYENLSNFNTAFKKKFGVTPAQLNKVEV
jgi:AraC-like DNA-binding protein